MQILRETIFLLLSFLDAEFTKRKLAELGVGVELNPLIRRLCRMLGTRYGVDLGVLVPTGVIAIVGWYLPHLLSFMIGVRFCLFLFQQRAQFNGK